MEQQKKNVVDTLNPAEAAAQALTEASSGVKKNGEEVPNVRGGNAGNEQKGNTGKKWIVPAGIAAAVVVVGSGVFMTRQKDPKQVVIDAFKSITAEGQLKPSEEIFGLREWEEGLHKRSLESGVELTVSGSSDESLNSIRGAGVGMDVKRDADRGRHQLDVSLKYGGSELAGAQLYVDDTQMMATVPVLTGRVLTLNYADDLEKQLIDSPYAAQMLEEKDIRIEQLIQSFRQYKDMTSSDEGVWDLSAIWKRYKEGSKALDDLKAAMTVTKNGEKEFTVDGQKVNAKGYHVVITQEALISFARTTKEFFLKDEELKQEVVQYLELVGNVERIDETDGDGETIDPEEQQKVFWTQVEAELDNLVEKIEHTAGDVAMDVYVRKDGKMAGFSYETDATVEDENVRLYGECSFGGGYNMLSNVNGALNIEDSEGQVITISLDKTGAYEAGKSWSGQVIATLEGEDEKYQFVYEGDYQIADGSYEIKLDFQENGASQAQMTASGTVSELLKGENIRVEMDSLRLETTLLDGSNSYVELAGTGFISPLEGEITQPSGTLFDVLASSEEDYNQLMSEINGNLLAVLLRVMS